MNVVKNQPVPPENAVSAPETVEQLIHRAEAAGASDIHLQMDDQGAVVSFRLDGLMTPATTFPRELADRVFGRIKFLAQLKTYQESMPQDGRIDKHMVHSQCDLRVATYPTVTGEKIVLRLFQTGTTRGLAELEYPPAAVMELQTFLRQTSGLLLLTGPAGSGKTTTIYACLRALAEMGGRHIITIEDPVEQIVPGVMQTEVNEARGLDFAKAARHLLRQDPQALVKEGNNLYSGLLPAGPLTNPDVPGTMGLGRVQAGALELSNVDLANEFSTLIITQRAFQACSRIITTSDEMVQELVNLKR